MTTTTDARITYDHPQWTAFKDAAQRLVNGFNCVPQEWLKLVAEHIDNDECVPFPMWGTCFVVQDTCDKSNIEKLLVDLAPDDSEDYGIDRADYASFEDCPACGVHTPTEGCPKCDGKGEVEDPDDFDEDGFNEAVRDAWRDSGDETAFLADSGWQAVGDTGIIAREFDGYLVLGIDGAGYDFYESHWVPLYRALGYSWHGSEGE